MNLEDIELPKRSSDLVELEERNRKLQAQRAEVEAKLRRIETHLARQAIADDSDADRLAEQLASGEIDRISTENLPAQQAQLRAELDIIQRSSMKLWPVLVKHRERHTNAIIRAFRPAHRAAAQRILRAVEELVAANAAEQKVRQACPVQLVDVRYPGTGDFTCNNARTAKYWRDHISHLGFLEPVEPNAGAPGASPPPKTKRKLFGRADGIGPESTAPAIAAKAAD